MLRPVGLMPLGFSIALLGVVVAFTVLRTAAPALPVRRFAHRFTVLQLLAVVLGTVGLVLHCAAMFDPALLEAAAGGYVAAVDAMGVPSVALSLLPALLIVIGIRHQNRGAVLAVAASLIAVVITMYDHGPLAVHLAAIFTSGTLLAATLALLAQLPRAGRPPRSVEGARGGPWGAG